MRQALTFLLLVLVCGCSYSKLVPGAPHLRVVHIGGMLRPGGTIVLVEPGSNAPVVVFQASAAPLAGNVLGTATGAAAGFLAGYGIGKDNDGGNSTTIIQSEPHAPPIVPPPQPSPPSRPPFGPPPWHQQHPNKGH